MILCISPSPPVLISFAPLLLPLGRQTPHIMKAHGRAKKWSAPTVSAGGSDLGMTMRTTQSEPISRERVSIALAARCKSAPMWQNIHHLCHPMHAQVLLIVHHKHSVHQNLPLVHPLIKIHLLHIFPFWSLSE